ncbi:hypothetical protein VZC37_02925 [Gordonia sp. LSe1-13]|uniref:Uncharacterized protein n=1 Tax=Gordonia sesuvii TaxID=3116777 RepID=A0ABU7M827_9ACTN|nr:hypothetical protein [Gordonia sp. LSe1-13]
MFDYLGHMNIGGVHSVIDSLAVVTVGENATGREVFDATASLVKARNVVDHQLAAHVRAMERLGVAKRSGGTTRQLLIEMGLAAPARHRSPPRTLSCQASIRAAASRT